MAQVMKKVDAVIVGFGWTGAIMAKELTEAGLQVVALERGPARDTYPDGVYPQTMDELTYNSRKKLFMDISRNRDLAPQRERPCRPVPPVRRFPAWHRHRWGRAALVRRALSGRPDGTAHAQPLRGTLWQGFHP